MIRRSSLCLVALSVAGAWQTGASAQQPAEAPTVLADRLFREGKEALEAGRFAEACPKLARSQELDPGTGTLLALALCHEGLGATATASREFADVVVAASQAGRPDRAALAQKHVADLQPTLASIEILVPSPLRGRLHVQVDKVDVPDASWGTPVPNDPGDHTVVAELPGAPPWKSVVHLRARDHQIVRVPELDAPPPEAAPAPEPPPQSRRTTALAVGGVGVGSFVLGSVFGVLALVEHGDATSLCPTSKCGNAQGVSENSTAESYAWVADFGIGIGLVAMGTAAYLLFTEKKEAPHTETSTFRVMPLVGPQATGLAVGASW